MKQLILLLWMATGVVSAAELTTHGFDIFPTNVIAEVQQSRSAYQKALATGYFEITGAEEAQIKQKINAYLKGDMSLHDLNENSGNEGNRELIGYYFLHTNEIPAKAKFPISRSFAAICAYPEAASLAAAYLNVFSNDLSGWKELGLDYAAIITLGLGDASNQVISAYGNAVRLGDKASILPLAGWALTYNRTNILEKLVPQLMQLKGSKTTLPRERLDLISVLLCYSIAINQKSTFIKTLKGEHLKELVQNDNVRKDMELGCKVFKGKDIDKIRRTLNRAELQNSNTNSYRR